MQYLRAGVFGGLRDAEQRPLRANCRLTGPTAERRAERRAEMGRSRLPRFFFPSPGVGPRARIERGGGSTGEAHGRAGGTRYRGSTEPTTRRRRPLLAPTKGKVCGDCRLVCDCGGERGTKGGSGDAAHCGGGVLRRAPFLSFSLCSSLAALTTATTLLRCGSRAPLASDAASSFLGIDRLTSDGQAEGAVEAAGQSAAARGFSLFFSCRMTGSTVHSKGGPVRILAKKRTGVSGGPRDGLVF